jgi:hypothetical protein
MCCMSCDESVGKLQRKGCRKHVTGVKGITKATEQTGSSSPQSSKKTKERKEVVHLCMDLSRSASQQCTTMTAGALAEKRSRVEKTRNAELPLAEANQHQILPLRACRKFIPIFGHLAVVQYLRPSSLQPLP